MKFSIVVPVYNAEKYIEDCLNSIVDQFGDVQADLSVEVLLVENGSTDNSGKICDRYASEHAEVKALHFGKIGAYNARREGMKAACGQYIFFADADDILASDGLKKLSGYIESLNNKGMKPDIVLYNAAENDSRNQKMFDFKFDENRLYEGADKEAFYEIMCKGDSLNALWNKCISRELADICLGEMSKDKVFNHGEDLLQTAQFIDKARSIAYLDYIFYYYRVNREGLTGAYHKEFLNNQMDAWKAFDEYAYKWTQDKFKSAIDERKTLTCMICIGKLVGSGAGIGTMKKELRNVLDSDFFKTYGGGKLPDWAPESSLYIQSLLQSDNAYRKLCREGIKNALKLAVKRVLSR